MHTKKAEYFKLIEDFINDYQESNGITPTIREIESGLGIPKTTVGRYLAYMREQGMLDYAGHRNIITKEASKTQRETVKVPLLGSVSCGIPRFAEENIEEYVRLPVALFGRGPFFLLRANGDSMIDADISHCDLVLIRQQDSADEGQIVVALMENEATLKRYYPEPEKHRVRLHPENTRMQDIIVENCIIQGVAVKVIKNLM